MGSFSQKYSDVFRRILPTPFSIAILLTVFVFAIAYFFGNDSEFDSNTNRIGQIADFWYAGLWKTGAMKFTLQMMLMLLLGHVIALSKPVEILLSRLAGFANNTANAVLIVAFSTILVSLFNWGLGLIFGALFVRKIGGLALEKGFKINYPILGAAGYSGLMVWHGGISGSAPIKAGENGNIKSMVLESSNLSNVPDFISPSETIFSSANIGVSLALLIVIPLVLYFMAKKLSPTIISKNTIIEEKNEIDPIGAEKIDYSLWFGRFIGVLVLSYAIYRLFRYDNLSSFTFLTPDYINLLLLGLALFFHKNIKEFLSSINQAIKGVSGILIQFPLYFGIMGMMSDAGLITSVSEWFSAISTPETFPFLTFISAGALNVLVPSGGGQWAVQGLLIIETALQNNIPLNKCIMALAYGDQLTNMMQPFWALPLLGITGLKAKEILPYTLMVMLVGIVIFGVGLLFY